MWNPNKSSIILSYKLFIFRYLLVERQLLCIFFVWHEMNCEEDRELICRCQAGDELAFESLVRKYQRELFHLVSWNVGSAAEAEDIVQDVFCKVYFSLCKFDNNRPFFPWLRRVAVNQCYDELRRVRRRKILRFTELNDQDARVIERLMSVPQAEPSAPTSTNGEEMRFLMHRVLDRLPEKQRMAIVLRDFKQVPYEEMADIMNCSKQAVRLKVFRARARLRTLITRALRRQEKLSHGAEHVSYQGARLATAEAES